MVLLTEAITASPKSGIGSGQQDSTVLKSTLVNNLYTGHCYKIANHPIDLIFSNSIDPVHDIDEFGQNMLMAEDRHLQMSSRFKQ